MKKIVYILLSLSILASCQKPEPDTGKTPGSNLPAYKELLAAYDAGKLYKEVQVSDASNDVVFEDGSKVTVPASAFPIHDHRDSPAPSVEVQPGMQWWSIGGDLTGVKVLPSDTPKEDAAPVYVYYDSKTLYMHLSNRELLQFGSKAVNDENTREEEIARRQNIPVIYIDTKGQGIYDKENYVKGTIRVLDPEKLYSDVEEFTATMGIRGRGNSTWSFPKKPWKVKLDSKASILGMPADKEWCLLANYADRTLLRNFVTMEISKRCGFSWTPRMVSVEVYLNSQYQGVYTFCEHKKVSSDRVDIDVDAGDVYLEIEQQQDETTCWWTDMGVPMMFSDPEEPSAELLAEIKKYISDFETCLYSPDFDDPDKGYAAYLDVKSFIDYYIVQELAKNTDGNLRKSTFITKKKGGKMEMYHLWDFDLTFGNNGWFLHEPEGYWVKDYAPDCNIGDNWFNRMFRDPVFVEMVQDRMEELRPQLESIPAFIDEQVLYLDKAKDRNFKVWDINESVDWVNCPSLGSYEKEVEFFKEFYTERLEWMYDAINKL